MEIGFRLETRTKLLFNKLKVPSARFTVEGKMLNTSLPLEFEGQIHYLWMYLPFISVKNCLFHVI